MEPLATIERLAARVAEPIVSPEEKALAAEMLEAASDEVRHYGLPWPSAAEAPAIAVTITVAAAARGYLNPSGFQMERGDAVTFNRGEDFIAGTSLTPEERRILESLAGRGGIVSTSFHNPDLIQARSKQVYVSRGYAPLYDGTKPFPLGVV